MDANGILDVQPTAKEGSQTREIPVNHVVAADKTVAATSNVSMVCMVKNTIAYCYEPVWLKYIFKVHEQLIEFSDSYH